VGRPHFMLFGIPVRVEPGFWVVALLLGYYPGTTVGLLVAWVAIVFVSILLHELGHALAFVAFGDRPAILLHPFGGLTFGRSRRKRWESVAVSLAGPLSALFLLGVPALVLQHSDWALESIDRENLVRLVVWVNVGWSVFNLLPILPLDGGHVAQELTGLRTARVISIVTAVPVALWAFSTRLSFAGIVVLLFGYQNLMALRAKPRTAPGAGGTGGTGGGPLTLHVPRPGEGRPAPASGSRGGPASPPPASLPSTDGSTSPGAPRLDALPEPWRTATAALAEGNTVSGLRLMEAAFLGGPAPDLVVAQNVADAGVATRLAQRLLSAGPEGVRAATDLQHHLHYAGRPAAAALVGERIAADGRVDRATVAFDTATAWSAAGDGDRAVRWLADAVDHGFAATALLDGEPDLAAARANLGWPAVRARLGG
jgi:Zn-dependent protease